jgi:glycosyltransferase involved in cell wall biosynthesis
MGGAEKCLTQLALNVDRTQFLPEVYSLQPPPTSEHAQLVEQLTSAGIPVHFLNARSWWNTPRVCWELSQHLRRQRAEVVQTFLFHANLLGTLAARLAGIRAILLGLRVVETARWRMWLERLIFPLAKWQIYVSKSVRRSYRNRRGRHHGYFVVPNAVQVDAYADAQPADLSHLLPEAQTPVILVAGRLHSQKGLAWLLSCLPKVFAAVPHHCVVVGEGPERAALQTQAKALGLEPRLHFLGWRADVPSLLQRAALLVLPSRYEGMPNIVLEAMAAGRMVVATRVEGVVELLGASAHQATVAYGDSEAMIAKIVEYAQHAARAEELGKLLQQRAREHFSILAMTHTYAQLWRAAVN